MADKWPLANGVWSNAANWNDGTKPVAGDDVFADGRTVTIDEDAEVASVRTTQRSGGTAGGGFTVNAGITITCDVIAGATVCVSFNSAGASTIIGDCTGSFSTTQSGVRNNSTGTLTIIGNCTGGTQTQAFGAANVANGILSIVGDCTAGSGLVASGANNQSTGTLTIVGNCTGGSGLSAFGVRNQSTGTLTIVGNCTGGTGPDAFGAHNSSTGILRVFGIAIGNDHGLGYSTNNGAPGVFGFGTNTGTNQALTTVRGIKYGLKGQSPTAGLVQLETDDLSESFASFRGEPNTFTEYIFGPPEFIGGQPTEADVRFGTEYNFGLRTGTLRVPDPQYVNAGVLTDDTIGTLFQGFSKSEMEQAIQDTIAAADLVTASMVTGGSVKSAKRTIDDETPLRFVWPTDDATITVERSINSAAYEAASGTVTFFRTEGVHHWYKLSYNAADRALGVVRYRLNDGVTTRYMTLQVEPVATTAQLTDTKNELVSEIGDIPDDILDSQRLVDQVVFSANTGFVTIDSLAGSLATANRLNDCLIRITDSDGRIQLRWIRSHFISSGVRAGFNPDLDFVPTPAVGDRVEIFNLYRGASNVVNWRGNVPNTLTSGRVDVLVGSMANNVVTTASINNGALTEAKFSTGFFGSIWSHATRTLTEVGNSTGVNTLLERIVGLIRTKAEDEVADSATADAIANIDLSTVATPQDVADARDAVIARGDEAWRTAITPGNWAITRSFATVDGSVVGVQMLLVGVAGKVVTSNANGLATLKVDNGSYVLRYTVPVFYEDIPDEPITIDDADDIAAEPITLVRKSLPPLSNNLLCLCTVTAINQHGDPAVDAAVVAETKNIGADDDQIFVFNEEREYWTDARGQAALPLLRNHRYAITVTFADFGSRTVLRTIPDQSDFHVLVKQ